MADNGEDKQPATAPAEAADSPAIAGETKAQEAPTDPHAHAHTAPEQAAHKPEVQVPDSTEIKTQDAAQDAAKEAAHHDPAATKSPRPQQHSARQRLSVDTKAAAGVLSSLARRLSVSLVPKPSVTPHLHDPASDKDAATAPATTAAAAAAAATTPTATITANPDTPTKAAKKRASIAVVDTAKQVRQALLSKKPAETDEKGTKPPEGKETGEPSAHGATTQQDSAAPAESANAVEAAKDLDDKPAAAAAPDVATQSPATAPQSNALKRLLDQPLAYKRGPSTVTSNIRRRLSQAFPLGSGPPTEHVASTGSKGQTQVKVVVETGVESNVAAVRAEPQADGPGEQSGKAADAAAAAASTTVTEVTSPSSPRAPQGSSCEQTPRKRSGTKTSTTSDGLLGPALVSKAEDFYLTVKRRLVSGPAAVPAQRKEEVTAAPAEDKAVVQPTTTAGHTPPLSPAEKPQKEGLTAKSEATDYGKKATTTATTPASLVANIKQALQGQLVPNSHSHTDSSVSRKKAEEQDALAAADKVEVLPSTKAAEPAVENQKPAQPTQESNKASEPVRSGAQGGKPLLVGKLTRAVNKVRSGLHEATATNAAQSAHKRGGRNTAGTAVAAGVATAATAGKRENEAKGKAGEGIADIKTGQDLSAQGAAADAQALANAQHTAAHSHQGHTHGKVEAGGGDAVPEIKVESTDSDGSVVANAAAACDAISAGGGTGADASAPVTVEIPDTSQTTGDTSGVTAAITGP
ncbi:unnamed protein product [Parajaminaea phylloscopi]